jgi:hypothetical protein
MYKLQKDSLSGKVVSIGFVENTLVSIPIAPDNTDYQTFKKDLADGAELQDAEGNVIDGIAYLEELA